MYFKNEIATIKTLHEQRLHSQRQETNTRLKEAETTWKMKKLEWDKKTNEFVEREKRKWEQTRDDLISKKQESSRVAFESMKKAVDTKALELLQLDEKVSMIVGCVFYCHDSISSKCFHTFYV